MAELNRIQQQVYDCVKEHNDMKGLGTKYYYYMYCCSGNKDVETQEAFDEYMEELEEEGLVKKTGEGPEILYCLSRGEEHEPSGIRSAAFAEIEREYIAAGDGQLSTLANRAIYQFFNSCGIKDNSTVIQALILAASIGTEGSTSLNPPERSLAVSVFGGIVRNSTDTIIKMMEQELDEEAFGMMTYLCNVGGKEAGLGLLRFILCFAYADGELSDTVAEKLQKVFKPVLE